MSRWTSEQRRQMDRRATCWCGHEYRDHATGGTHCLAASNDPDQRTGQDCPCHYWEPTEPRFILHLGPK